MQSSELLNTHLFDGVLVIQFNHEKPQNPVSQALGESIIKACEQAHADDHVKAIVLTGGVGRSFSSGGDFNEVRRLSSYHDVAAWIDRTIALYLSVLEIRKPTVAAIDEYAIGIGFQLALSCDWRIGTPECKHSMWELKHGIACTIGGYMLEKQLTRAEMTELVFGAEVIPAGKALEYKVLNEIVSRELLLSRAIEKARQLADYPQVPYQKTKASINRSFIEGLKSVAQNSKDVHAASFGAGAATAHFNRVLKAEETEQMA